MKTRILKSAIRFLFGADLWKSRFGVMAAASFLSLLWFVTDWCMATTFRSMSSPTLWIVNIAAALVLTLPFALCRRVWVQMVWILALDALFEANIMYCRTYFTAIPPDNYSLVGNLSDFTASVFDSLAWTDAGFVVIAVAAWIAALRMPERPVRRFAARYTAVTLTALLAATVAVGVRGSFFAQYDRLVQSCYYSTCGVPTYTLAGHIAYSLHSAAPPSAAELAAARRWIAAHDAEHSGMKAPLPADSVRRNLVVILLESFESWPVERRVGSLPITPYIDSLVSLPSTLYAPNMLTQVASGRSIDCQLMLCAGLLPPYGSVYSMKYPQSAYLTLNKAMRERYGAKSYIFTADKPTTWNQAIIARSFGYDSLIDRRAWRHDELIGNPAKLSDGSFLRQAVAELAKGHIWPPGAPRMLTFVTYSGHNPFVIPPALRDSALSAATKGMPEGVRHYIDAVHYTDSQLRILVRYIFSRPDAAQTLVVITGDHEGLASLRRQAMRSPKSRGLVSPGQFTPFIVLNSPEAGRVESVIGQIDMYPTLLSLLGLETYRWKGVGHNILGALPPQAAVSSMTGIAAGDTTAAPGIGHLRSARRTSDVIIRGNLLAR